jgi:flagellar protein FlaG
MSNAISSPVPTPPRVSGAAQAVVPAANIPKTLPATESSTSVQPVRIQVSEAQKRKELDEAVKQLNEQVRKNSYNLNFSVDDATNYVVVKVKNTDSGDVIRQIPSETVLRVAHNIEAVKGMLRDQEV